MVNNKLNSISSEDFDFLVKNGKRSSVLLNHDFEDLTLSGYGFLKFEIPKLFLSGDFEKLFFELLKDRGFKFLTKWIKDISVSDALSFILWLKDELESIAELEKNYLSSQPNAMLLKAGISKLNQFGDMNTIDNLAGGDILKYEQIKKMRYFEVFEKQYREVLMSEITTKLNK